MLATSEAAEDVQEAGLLRCTCNAQSRHLDPSVTFDFNHFHHEKNEESRLFFFSLECILNLKVLNFHQCATSFSLLYFTVENRINCTLTKNQFISWQKKHNFIAQHCTKKRKQYNPQLQLSATVEQACLPKAFISLIPYNTVGLNINSIANRNRSLLRWAQWKWRPSQTKMSDSSSE